jgi:hypothetical protein
VWQQNHGGWSSRTGIVIPAQAGTHFHSDILFRDWVPACAGMTWS